MEIDFLADKMYRVLHRDERGWLELLVWIRKVTRVLVLFYEWHLGRCAQWETLGSCDKWLLSSTKHEALKQKKSRHLGDVCQV